MENLLMALVFGLIPAFIAKSKGRSFGKWYVYGVLLFLIALIHSVFLKGSTKCPSCAEWISKEAKICKECKREIV